MKNIPQPRPRRFLGAVFGLFCALLALGGPQLASTAHAQSKPFHWAADSSADVPYTFHDLKDQNKLTGFEYDLMQELSRHMGAPLDFINNDWDGLIPGLQRGLYDMVICGIEMTDEHAEGIDFSIPYYVTSERLVVRRKGKQLTTMADLEGHTVGTIKDTQAERMLTNNTKISLRTYDEETDAFMDLVNGRTDAILIDGPIANTTVRPIPNCILWVNPLAACSMALLLPMLRIRNCASG